MNCLFMLRMFLFQIWPNAFLLEWRSRKTIDVFTTLQGSKATGWGDWGKLYTKTHSDFCWSFPAQLTKTICAVVSPHPSFNTFSLDYSNTIYTRPDGFHVLCCLVPLFKIWFMKNNSFTIPGLYQPDDIQWKSVRERLMPLR